MIEMPWTPAQIGRLRSLLGVPAGDRRDPTAADILVVMDASEILAAAAARWDGEGPKSGQLSPTNPGRASSFYSPGWRLRRSARVRRRPARDPDCRT